MSLKIPGRVREMCCEVMYDHSESESTIAHLTLDAILKVKLHVTHTAQRDIHIPYLCECHHGYRLSMTIYLGISVMRCVRMLWGS